MFENWLARKHKLLLLLAFAKNFVFVVPTEKSVFTVVKNIRIHLRFQINLVSHQSIVNARQGRIVLTPFLMKTEQCEQGFRFLASSSHFT